MALDVEMATEHSASTAKRLLMFQPQLLEDNLGVENSTDKTQSHP
jgi:hypothetical protein